MAVSTAYVNQILPKDAARVAIPGHVIQTLYNNTQSMVSLSSGSWISSGLSLNIVTAALNSKILIQSTVGFNFQSSSATGISFRVTRNGSGVWTQGQTRASGISGTGDNEFWATLIYLDSPNVPIGTTLTYDIQANGPGRLQDATKSSIVIQEIAQ